MKCLEDVTTQISKYQEYSADSGDFVSGNYAKNFVNSVCERLLFAELGAEVLTGLEGLTRAGARVGRVVEGLVPPCFPT